ncbi:hypothetical protein DVH24_014424, partial [Malus domestica]
DLEFFLDEHPLHQLGWKPKSERSATSTTSSSSKGSGAELTQMPTCRSRLHRPRFSCYPQKIRRELRRKFLLKLRAKYQAEIKHCAQWRKGRGNFSGTKGGAAAYNGIARTDTTSLDGFGVLEIQGTESGCGSLVDELLLLEIGETPIEKLRKLSSRSRTPSSCLEI